MKFSGPANRRRWLFVSLYACYLLALGWLGVYGFWIWQEQKTGRPKTDVWGYYYRKLPEARDADIQPQDESFDVLLLGGSVLEQVAPVLEQRLVTVIPRPVRVFSVCTSAHTSRDSYLKATQLDHQPFDLIVIYHGINDARMNCVRDDLFQEDYTHCAHYESLNRTVKAGSLTVTGLVQNQVENLIGLGEPEADQREYGKTIKTKEPFRKNLEGILEIAKGHSTPVVLMTFAYWVPEGYSKPAFEKKQLGYGTGQYELPIEVWGQPQDVIAAIEAHNSAIRELAESYEVIFIDQAELLPADGQHFCDICHLTESGIERFAENLVANLQLPAKSIPIEDKGNPNRR